MKKYANDNKWLKCTVFGCLTVFVPITLHGIYDFLLFLDNGIALLMFFAFVVMIDIASIAVLIVSIFTDKKIAYSEQLRCPLKMPEDIDFVLMDDEMIVEEISSP